MSKSRKTKKSRIGRHEALRAILTQIEAFSNMTLCPVATVGLAASSWTRRSKLLRNVGNYTTSLFHQQVHVNLTQSCIIIYFRDMFRRICTIFRVNPANFLFKTQPPFRSQMHSIKCCVCTIKWLNKIVKMLQVQIKDYCTQL